MSQLSLPRPAPDESAPFYHGYISEVPGEQIGNYLDEQLQELERLITPLDDTTARGRYAPGKWSVKEVLGHLIDTERIFSYRLLRIGRGDTTPLPGFDENAYVPAGDFDARPLAAIVGELRAVRLGTIALMDGLPREAWTRRGEANGKAISARALAYIIVGHTTHHTRVLRERYRLAMVLRICDNGREQVVPASAELVEQVFAPEATIAEGTEITVAEGNQWLAALAVGAQGSAAEFLLSGAAGERATASGRAGRGDALRHFRDFLSRRDR
jgi:DinB family protein